MKWFRKLFKKKKKSYPQDNEFSLWIIGGEGGQLLQYLGITVERAQELRKLCIDSYQKNELLYKCLDDLVKGCVHTNEIVFATMVMHKVIDRFNAKNRLDDLMKNLFNNG